MVHTYGNTFLRTITIIQNKPKSHKYQNYISVYGQTTYYLKVIFVVNVRHFEIYILLHNFILKFVEINSKPNWTRNNS